MAVFVLFWVLVGLVLVCFSFYLDIVELQYLTTFPIIVNIFYQNDSFKTSNTSKYYKTSLQIILRILKMDFCCII